MLVGAQREENCSIVPIELAKNHVPVEDAEVAQTIALHEDATNITMSSSSLFHCHARNVVRVCREAGERIDAARDAGEPGDAARGAASPT